MLKICVCSQIEFCKPRLSMKRIYLKNCLLITMFFQSGIHLKEYFYAKALGKIFSDHKRIVTRPKILHGIFCCDIKRGQTSLFTMEMDLNTTLIPTSSKKWSSKKSCMWNVLLQKEISRQSTTFIYCS